MGKAIFLLFFTPSILCGQSSTIPQEQSRVNNMNELMKQNTSSLVLYYKGSEIDVDGSKYFHNDYVTGELWFMNGDYISTGYLFKFDESENSVQIKDKNGNEILADGNKISGCRININDKAVLYFRTEVPQELNKTRLFQLLYNSDVFRVIKLPSKQLITKNKIFHDDALQYEYVNYHRYFIQKKGGEYEEFKLKKKSLIELFPEKKTLINKLLNTPQYKERFTEVSFVALLTELEKKTQ